MIPTFPTSNPANEHNKTPAKTRRRTPIMDRIAAKTDLNGPMHPEGPHKGRCHINIGARSESGTGSGIIHGYHPITGKRCLLSVARVVYEHHHGTTIPDGLVVRHTCDNRLCCNPEHLILGTQADNMRDKVERGRSSAPRPHINALKCQQVVDMRTKGATHKEIMARTGASRTWLKNFLKRQEQPAPLPLFDGPAILH